MDISKSLVSETAVITDFLDPNGDIICDEKGVPCWIEIYSGQSEKFLAKMVSINNAQAAKDKGKRKHKGGDKITVASVNKDRKKAVELLADCTKSWGGFVINGGLAEATRENVVLLYTNAPYIKDRIDSDMAGEDAFFDQPQTS